MTVCNGLGGMIIFAFNRWHRNCFGYCQYCIAYIFL